ncbi:MAG: glutathione S-transferase family protein [Thermoanaerobaculales bacterium]
METKYRLITIPPSHYCEKARWALELARVSYQEEPHAPLLHRRATKKAGGGQTAPVLVTDHGVLSDSTDILEFLDSQHPDTWRPYPQEDGLRAEVEELEELFDTKLGSHTRRIAYFHLLQHRELFLGSVLPGVGSGERKLFRSLRPVICWLMRRGMRINPASAERSLEQVRNVFATVSVRLADGRSFLVGDSFTAADLTFAALAAPVLLPRGYGSPLPTLADIPGELLALVEEMREAPAGAFALRLYRDHR